MNLWDVHKKVLDIIRDEKRKNIISKRIFSPNKSINKNYASKQFHPDSYDYQDKKCLTVDRTQDNTDVKVVLELGFLCIGVATVPAVL